MKYLTFNRIPAFMTFLLQSSKTKTARYILREILRHDGCMPDDAFIANPGFDPAIVLPYADDRSEPRFFPGINGKKPAEIVSSVDKFAISNFVFEKYRQWKFNRGEPWFHVWYYPGTYRTLAAFRVDCDSSDHQTIFNLADHAQSFRLPLTWFLHVEAQEFFLADIKDLQKTGHEIGLHCYHHETWDDFQLNLENVVKGRDIMVKAGLHPNGFVSPFGKWNPALNRVLEQMDFRYSSEFACGYDNFPFFPFTGNVISRVLQLPIHPVCIGSLRKSGHSPDEMVEYFTRFIRKYHHERRPIMLYGHPYREIDYYGEVIREVFRLLSELENTWITTYSDYTTWWKKRISIQYKAIPASSGITIDTENSDRDLTLRLVTPAGREMFFPLISGFHSYPEN